MPADDPADGAWLGRQRDCVIAVLLMLGTLVATVLLRLSYLLHFAPGSEGLASLLHSSQFGAPSPAAWLFKGRTNYTITYPELGLGNDSLRPVSDVFIYLNSLIAPGPESPVMLALNYVGHAACVALVYLVGRRVLEMSRRASVLGALLFMGTVTVVTILTQLAYNGDLLVGLLSLGALVVVGNGRGWRGIAAGLLILLALFSKEGGVAAPALVGVYLALRIRGSRHADGGRSGGTAAVLRYLPPALIVGLPSLVYLAFRLTRRVSDNHTLRDLTTTSIFGIPMPVLNPVRFVATAFFPVEPEVLKASLGASGPADIVTDLALARAPLALALSLAGWAVVLLLVVRGPARSRVRAGLLLALAASVLPIAFKADPRYMYLSQALFLPLLVLALVQLRERVRALRGRAVTAGVLGLVLFAGPVYLAGDLLISNVRLRQEAVVKRQLLDTLVAEARRDDVEALYAVNVPDFASPGLPLLQFAAFRAGRRDLTVRVTNSLSSWDARNRSGDEGVRFTPDGDVLRIAVTSGEEEHFFAYLTPEQASRLGEPGVIRYGTISDFDQTRAGRSMVADNELTFSVPLDRGTALVGVDPGRDGVYVYRTSDGGDHWVAAGGAAAP